MAEFPCSFQEAQTTSPCNKLPRSQLERPKYRPSAAVGAASCVAVPWLWKLDPGFLREGLSLEGKLGTTGTFGMGLEDATGLRLLGLALISGRKGKS
ncbi:hypothetical protein AV530_011436 [Patagioenas fasciata monilis]|uniref:Uncharacterized protein n=1 Tax=Patagioenas fasciata monilis TaxID=372326 RepID=A0A1V4KPC7_PATFA|nr:hypothetical protein AV530_011436 [Patagioenas fasciata monilis]